MMMGTGAVIILQNPRLLNRVGSSACIITLIKPSTHSFRVER